MNIERVNILKDKLSNNSFYKLDCDFDDLEKINLAKLYTYM